MIRRQAGARLCHDGTHLERMYAPVQDRLRLLISIALAKEIARSLIHGTIAEPVKEDLSRRVLSGNEADDLTRMRRAYVALFRDSLTPDDTVGKPHGAIASAEFGACSDCADPAGPEATQACRVTAESTQLCAAEVTECIAEALVQRRDPPG